MMRDDADALGADRIDARGGALLGERECGAEDVGGSSGLADQAEDFIDGAGRDEKDLGVAALGSRAVLEAEVGEVAEPADVAEWAFAELRELLDVSFDFCGNLESQLAGGGLHPASLVADGLCGID